MRFYITIVFLMLSIPGYAATLYFPQIADGGGYQTTVTISNPGNSAVTGTLRFFTPAGSPWSLSINSTVNSEFSVSIPGSGSARFVTAGTGPIVTGWASVESDGVLSGVATFDLRSQERLAETVGVLGASAAKRFMVPADRDSLADVGVAIINTSATRTLTVNLSLVDEDGNVILTSSDPDYRNIPRQGYVAKFASQAFPDMPGTHKGALIGEVSGTGSMAVIGLVMKDGLMSATPVTDPSLAAAKKLLGEWSFVTSVPDWIDDPWEPDFSIRAIEEDQSNPGQFYAWGYDSRWHGALVVHWDYTRGSYVGTNASPEEDWTDIYEFHFTDENRISGCYYYQEPYYPDPLDHPLGECFGLTGARVVQ